MTSSNEPNPFVSLRVPVFTVTRTHVASQGYRESHMDFFYRQTTKLIAHLETLKLSKYDMTTAIHIVVSSWRDN